MRINDVSAQLTAGRTTVQDHVEQVLSSLDALDRTPWHNLVASRADHAALRQASILDAELRSGSCRGPLHGLAIAVKDNIDVAGMPTRAGSGVYSRMAAATRDAEVVSLLRQAGAIVVAKTHLHELGYGSVGDVNVNGPARNPHDPALITGGSSSGSAALVALGCVALAVGTDTGCSVRAPAALCGVVGVMPPLGAMPTTGVLPVSTTFDHVGLITEDVASAKVAWSSLTKHDTAAESPTTGALRIGRPMSDEFTTSDAVVDAAVDRCIDDLRSRGASIVTVDVPGAELSDAYSAIVAFEMHARHVEIDGTHLQPALRERLAAGARITDRDYRMAYERVNQLRHDVMATLNDARIDALVLPTTPCRATRLGDTHVGDEPVSSALLRMCVPFSVLGTPAISIPGSAHGLPVGVQLVGIGCDVGALLAIAESLTR